MKTLRTQLEKWRPREQEKVRIQAVDPATQEKQLIEAPAWLFRGERAVYPSTYSSFHRFSMSGLSKTAQEEVAAVTRRLDYILQRYGLEPMYSAALLQHYFLPTELIDLTESLDDAGAFAAYKNTGEVGVLMAFPTEHLQKHGLVIDLKRIHFARRPRHQHAYVWFHRTEPNLTEASLLEIIKAEKAYFQGDAEDLDHYQKHYVEICGPPNADATCGLLNKLFEDVVLVDQERRVRYSISEEARNWIEERIPWAPVPMRECVDAPGTMEPAWDQF
jgi:hypothetical protein